MTGIVGCAARKTSATSQPLSFPRQLNVGHQDVDGLARTEQGNGLLSTLGFTYAPTGVPEMANGQVTRPSCM